jgi:hypothetical protein
MSVEALGFLLTQGVQVPFVKSEISELASFKVVCNLAWHADINGFVWLSDRTQEREIDMNRSHIWSVRRLLEREGWLKYTGQRKQKGVKVYKLEIPGFSFSGLPIPTTKELSGSDSGSTSGLPSGSDSGLASGSPSGLASGLFCGLPYPTEKEIKEFEIKENEKTKTQKNNLDHLPENVRERIKQNRRSRGEYGETTLGEAVQDIFKNIEPPNQQDEEPF